MPIPSSIPTTTPLIPEKAFPLLFVESIFIDASRRDYGSIATTIRVVNFAEDANGLDFDNNSRRDIKTNNLFALAERVPALANAINAVFGAVALLDAQSTLHTQLDTQLQVATVDIAAKQLAYTTLANEASTLRRIANAVQSYDTTIAELEASNDPSITEQLEQYRTLRALALETLEADEAAAIHAETLAATAKLDLDNAISTRDALQQQFADSALD